MGDDELEDDFDNKLEDDKLEQLVGDEHKPEDDKPEQLEGDELNDNDELEDSKLGIDDPLMNDDELRSTGEFPADRGIEEAGGSSSSSRSSNHDKVRQSEKAFHRSTSLGPSTDGCAGSARPRD